MREASLPLATPTIQPILRGMTESLAPNVICDSKPSGFKVISKWTCQFVKHYMNWTFKVNTITINKLPTYWQDKGEFMAYRVAYLAKAYNIPLSLVVNIDQTDIHFVATPLWPSVGVKPNTSKVEDLESSGTPECLEFDSKAQNTSH